MAEKIFMENKTWIRIGFNNACYLEGKDELLKELREVCPVQSRDEWLPSAFPGFELFLDINFNLNLHDFINNVVIPNAEFIGLIKVCKQIWTAFKSFLDKNEEYDFQHFNLYFDDVVIVFRGNPSYGTMMKVYQSLHHHLDVLEKNNITEISEIRFPYCEEENEKTGETEYMETYWDNEDKELLWKVKYMLGCETCFYNPQKESIIA